MVTATQPQSARRHYALSVLVAQRAVTEARKAKPRGLLAIMRALFIHQAAQATLSERAVTEMLAEQDIESAPDARLDPLAFTTQTQTLGRMIEAAEDDARFDRLVESLVQAAGRAAESVSVAVRPDIWHVRFVSIPCCPRCAVLAGKVYRYSEGFLRHPNCFPAGVMVSGPATLGATRRRYEGELVILRTASGEELPATGNHPVLTDQGWVPANLLQVGDHVVRSTRTQGALPLVIPDEQQAPTLIENVRRSDGMVPFGVVPTAAEDFHGDGGNGEVDVVLADRLLWDGFDASLAQLGQKEEFASRVTQPLRFPASGPVQQLRLSVPHAAYGVMGGSNLRSPLLGGHALGAQTPGLRLRTDRDPGLNQAPPDDNPLDPQAFRQCVLALTGLIGGDNGAGVQRQSPPPRWDAPPGQFSTENRAGYAQRGADLRKRLAGQVELDRIVELRRISWSGHVYNLTSAEGWFSANGLIVSNCKCTMIPTTVASPLRQNPNDLFERGQIRGLSKADTAAINDGADLSQVVNVRRKAAGLQESGRVLSRAGRPTPEGIYRMASDREQAVELLTRFGYVR